MLGQLLASSMFAPHLVSKLLRLWFLLLRLLVLLSIPELLLRLSFLLSRMFPGPRNGLRCFPYRCR